MSFQPQGFQQDAFQSGASDVPGSAIDCDNDWWSGVQNCFVGVALAGAALALSAATVQARSLQYQNEEIVPQPVAVADATGSFAQRAQIPTTFQRWAFTDELPVAVAAFIPVEDDPPQLGPDRTTVTAILWASGDDGIPAVVVPEDDSWEPPWIVPSPLGQQPLWDDAAVVPQASTFIPVEDEWQPPAARSLGAFLTPPWADSDDLPILGYLEPDAWQEGVVLAAGYAAQPISADDDVPRVVAHDDDFWNAPPVPIPAAVVAVWIGDADLPITPPAFTVDDDIWTTFYSVPVLPTLRPPWTDGDDCRLLAATPPMDDEWLQPAPRVPAPTLAAWFGEDDLPVTAATTPFEDDAWLRPQGTAPTLQIASPNWDDQALTWARDEEYWQAPLVRSVAPSFTLWTNDDDRPSNVLDDGYQSNVAMLPLAPVLRVWTHQDERETVPPPIVHEDYWIDLKPYFAEYRGHLFADDDALGVSAIPDRLFDIFTYPVRFDVLSETKRFDIFMDSGRFDAVSDVIRIDVVD
jgi:hypothetical protein